jgi:YVTN family beta-propeller protein
MRSLMLSTALALVVAGCTSGNVTNNSSDAGNNAANAATAQFDIQKVPLPGEGRGDYILADTDARRLYVTHTASVHILDLDTLKPIGEVTGLKKAHGVAIAGGKGFASDGDGNSVIVFDPATGRKIKTIAAGQNPDSILFDAASGMVFVFNGTSKDISVIDPAKEAIVKTIPIGDKPEFSRADGKGKIFVNLEDGHAIAVIDTKALTIATKYVLDDCEGPAALGFDPDNRRLFSSCGNGVMKVVDADSGRVVANLPVGVDPDGIAYDASHKRIYVAARDGGWTIVDQKDADTYSVNQVLKIDEYAKTTAFDPKTGRVFSTTADLVWPKEVAGKKLLPDAKPGSFRLLVVTAK